MANSVDETRTEQSNGRDVTVSTSYSLPVTALFEEDAAPGEKGRATRDGIYDLLVNFGATAAEQEQGGGMKLELQCRVKLVV